MSHILFMSHWYSTYTETSHLSNITTRHQSSRLHLWTPSTEEVMSIIISVCECQTLGLSVSGFPSGEVRNLSGFTSASMLLFTADLTFFTFWCCYTQNTQTSVHSIWTHTHTHTHTHTRTHACTHTHSTSSCQKHWDWSSLRVLVYLQFGGFWVLNSSVVMRLSPSSKLWHQST